LLCPTNKPFEAEEEGMSCYNIANAPPTTRRWMVLLLAALMLLLCTLNTLSSAANSSAVVDPVVVVATSNTTTTRRMIVEQRDVQQDIGSEADAACYQVAGNMTCVDCLKKAGCGFWQPELDSCAASCIIADATCYSNDTALTSINGDSNTNMTTVEEICEQVANKEAHLVCSSQTNCGDCVATSILSGSTTCQWFDEGQFCASGCGVDGCGKLSCEADNDDDAENDDESNGGGGGGEEQEAPTSSSPPTRTAPAASVSTILATWLVSSCNVYL
jgi:hypothetical protein